MVRLAADENFHRPTLIALRRHKPDIDVVIAQNIGLAGLVDPLVLEWSARENRVVLTHDVSTMPEFAWERVRLGQPMSGVIVVSDQLSVGRAVADLLLLIECNRDDEWDGRVYYVPL